MEIKELINDCVTNLNDYCDRLAELDIVFKKSNNANETISALLELHDKVEQVSHRLYKIPLPLIAKCEKELSRKLNSVERHSRNLIKEIEDYMKELRDHIDYDSSRIIGIMFPNQEDRDEYYNDFF